MLDMPAKSVACPSIVTKRVRRRAAQHRREPAISPRGSGGLKRHNPPAARGHERIAQVISCGASVEQA